MAAAQIGPPLADHHQHLFSVDLAKLVSVDPVDADKLIAFLDSAGIKRALVLAMGYSWGNPSRTVENEYEHVKAENDWTAAEVARYPDRLRAFCSFNPLRDYALTELNRCAAHPGLRAGVKLHIGNSAVDYHNPQQLEQMRRVFRAANEHRMPIVIHMRSSISKRLPYGRVEARIFYDSVLTAAPDVPVQIAHLAGAGGYDSTTDAALSVFVDAIARHDARAQRLWLDVTTVARGDTEDDRVIIATRLRQLGVSRVLFGADAATGANLKPRAAWAEFLKLPLAEDELRTIASNVAPYMRERPATPDSVWAAALARLSPRNTIRVHQIGLSGRTEGQFARASATMLALAGTPASVEYPLTTIDSLWVRGNSAKTGAVIGGISGAIAGVAFGVMANEVGCKDDGGNPCPEAMPLLGLAGAATGALLGALIGAAIPRWHLRVP